MKFPNRQHYSAAPESRYMQQGLTPASSQSMLPQASTPNFLSAHFLLCSMPGISLGTSPCTLCCPHAFPLAWSGLSHPSSLSSSCQSNLSGQPFSRYCSERSPPLCSRVPTIHVTLGSSEVPWYLCWILQTQPLLPHFVSLQDYLEFCCFLFF